MNIPTQEIVPQKAEKTEAQLVQELRGGRSFREFEDYLNESIPAGMPGATTFASAWNWVKAVHAVNPACLMAWITFYPEKDPRHQLATTILAMRAEGKEDNDSPAEKKTKPKIRPIAG
jgi:hypothetical protein